MQQINIVLNPCVQLRGDILVKCYDIHRSAPGGRRVIFRCQFHTCAISDYTLQFQRSELDEAYSGQSQIRNV